MKYRVHIHWLWVYAFCSYPAFADSLEFGVASRCDSSNNHFEIVGIAEANDMTTVLTSSLDRVKKLGFGTNHIECNIGGEIVRSIIEVRRGYGGHCTSVGSAEIKSLRIGRKVIQQVITPESPGEPFNWMTCFTDVLVRLSIYKSGSFTMINRCWSKGWDWDTGYAPISCKLDVVR